MVHPVDRHVGERVRLRRWMLGMTQEQLATLLGVKFQQLQKYETGANRIAASRLWDIAAALEVPISFFFEGIGEERGVPDPFDRSAGKEPWEFLRIYRSLPEKQRRQLRELVTALGAAQARGADEADGG